MTSIRSLGVVCVLCVLLLGGGGVAQATLVDWWRLEEGPGNTTTADSGTGGHTGTLVADAAWDTVIVAPVASGSTASIYFDGTGDQVTMTGYKGITGTDPRTLAAWIKTEKTTVNQNGIILSWGQNNAGKKWTFRVQDSNGTKGTIRLEVNGGYIVGNTVVTDGDWHHVAATWFDDDSPNVRDVLLYVDGVLDADFGGTPAPSASLSKFVNTGSSANVAIGGFSGGNISGTRFQGWIDDVRIYDEALSAGQIYTLAVPEPSSLVLIAGGLIGLCGRLRRRRGR